MRNLGERIRTARPHTVLPSQDALWGLMQIQGIGPGEQYHLCMASVRERIAWLRNIMKSIGDDLGSLDAQRVRNAVLTEGEQKRFDGLLADFMKYRDEHDPLVVAEREKNNARKRALRKRKHASE